MYYSFEDNYYLIFEHESETSLPIEGWFHNCIFCFDVTGNLVDYPNKYIDIKLSCCSKCSNKPKNSKDMLKLKDWIYENIPKSRRKFFCSFN
tara:strand:+ start:142 stop:417 length:276 start_codon:yes stop_codon:yes gene_type:complete